VLLERLLSNLSVHVEPFALCMVDAGWRLRLPGRPEASIHFVLEGEGNVIGPGGDAHRLEPYTLAVVPRGTKHALEPAGNIRSELKIDTPPDASSVCSVVAGPSKQPALTIACGIVTVRYGQSFGLFDHLHDILSVGLADYPQVKNAFSTILAEQSRPSPGGETLTAALMTTCLVHFLRQLAEEEVRPLPWLAALEDKRLGRVVDAILEEPGADHTVESLGDVAAMSRSAFAERFHEAFDRSPMGFVKHVRMQRAGQLLREVGQTVDEVAVQVGFSSRSHFSSAFKKHHGLSPAKYRIQGMGAIDRSR